MISVQTGSLTIPVGTGNQAISGLRFQPKAIIFFGTTAGGVYGDGYNGGVYTALGFCTSTTDDASMFNREDNAASSAGFWAHTAPDTGRCINGDTQASLVSFDANGFTLNWSTLGSSGGSTLYFVAFGGATLSAKAGIINPSGTGNLAFTGVGFQPEMLMILHSRGQTWGTDNNARSQIDYGFATGSAAGQQWAIQAVGNSGSSGTAAAFDTGKIDDWGNASLTSFDADGFTLNFGGSPGGANYAYLCLADSAGGTTFKAGNDTQKTSTGTKATTGLGFAPGSLLAAGICHQTANAQQDNDYRTFGFYDGANHRCMWSGATHNQNPTVTAVRKTTSVLLSHSAPGSTTNAEAIVSSLDSDGFTLDWTTADATARAFGYVAILSDTPVGDVSFDGILIG